MARFQRFLDALSRLQQRHGLLLFLALGAALFTVDGLRSRPAPLPPLAEADADAARWLEDEVLYREARARGLDEGDLIVRRRLVQKMRLLLETAAEVEEPDAETLADWVARHPQRYGGLVQLAFDHVFLSRSLRGATLDGDAAATAAALAQAHSVAGDPHPAGSGRSRADAAALSRLFGTAFAAQFATLPEHSWQGPLPSALGLHFVRIRERQLGVPDPAAVQAHALRDYLVEQRARATREAIDALKRQYGLAAAP